MLRFLLFPIITLLLTSCAFDKQEKASTSPAAHQPVVKRVLSEPPIDIAALKQSGLYNVTSGEASIDWVSKWKYCKPLAPGFFGFYYVAAKDAPLKGPFGLLMVYAAKPLDWSDAKADERFVEITLKEEGLALWDSVRVGLTQEALYKMLGNDNWRTEGTSHFKTLGQYGAEFIVIDGVVSQVRVGKYCAE